MSEHSSQIKTVVTTLNKLSSYKAAAIQFGQQSPANASTKLWFAITRSEKAVNAALKPLYDLNSEEQEELDDILRNNQATDAQGILMYQLAPDPKSGEVQRLRQYTAAGEKKRDKEVKECKKKYSDLRDALVFDEEGNDKTVELRVHVSPEYPNGLHPSFVEVFKGIVLDDSSYEKMKLVPMNQMEKI